ncbi:hypothetical protein DICVIV_02421 [Dictyocaulus viviparus]|uniref:3'-5' exonuclease domain-containing protein n=1 Tax=Dictyocaulus viviparus TaxID=29172 RepID=A0A0D8Y5E1_DICVI|nr:hypothetical protein DICVIV_02421 [Dictyocaulus viviparus]
MDITEEQAEVILSNLCKLYKVEQGELNTSRSRVNSSGCPMRVKCLPLAKRIFDPIPHEKVPAVYLALFDCLPKYVSVHGSKIDVKNDYYKQSFTVEELLVIVPYQLPHSVKTSKSRNAGNANNKKSAAITRGSVRVHLKIEHSIQLIRHFLPIKLPVETKIWKQIRYILVPTGNCEKIRLLGPEVAKAYADGTISFAALTFMMKDEILSQFIDEPEAILHALYLGPLGAATVEMFASGRSANFRKKCRAVLNEAVAAMKSSENFMASIPPRLSDSNPELSTYLDFRHNTQNLIRDLRGESSTDGTIPIGWACAALKKFARKTYIEKTWKEENLYELIWTIMSQRPHLKNYICNLLEKDFHDYGAARFWRSMQPAVMRRTSIRSRNETFCDPLLPTEDFLNFTAEVKSITFVRTTGDLRILTKDLNQLKNGNLPVQLIVGLDAEWSAYVAKSRATILQMSLRDRIFIIDLDNRAELPENELREFFEMLFLDKAILKLGFQFNEDLTQLRAAVPRCRALFVPENVICVGKLFAELLERTEKLEDCEAILSEVLPPTAMHVESEQMEMDGDSTDIENQQQESIFQRTVNRGLSYVCERVLGRPLDKTEQCSVWDRRPLRSSQACE